MFARINVILSGAKNLLTCLRKLAFARDPSPAFSGFRMTMLFLFFVLSLALYTSPVFAQTLRLADARSGQATTPASPTIPYTLYPIPSSVSPTSPLYTDLLVNNMFHTFSCLAIGQSIIGQPCLTYQVTRNAQGMIQGVPVLSQVNLSGGTLGAVTSVIGALYMNPPVRTADYLASVGQGLGIVKEAHAQVGGSGAAVLSPILTLWQVSRNVSYIIMIIVFLVIGLMIMFRNRINPQTVITAQAALPGLVIGLILITFSYFLAGLVSDFAFIGTNVVGYYFTAAQGKPPQNLAEDMTSQNVLKIFSPLTRIASSSKIADILGSIWNDLTDPSVNRQDLFSMDPQKALTTLTALMMTQLLMPFGNMAGGWGQAIVGLGTWVAVSAVPVQIASMALSFIAMIILIYAMFKLLLRLINNFLTIIFLTITAPFQLLASALPGRQGIATSWILNMLANILAFPAVMAVLYFVAFILGPDFINQNNFPNCTDPPQPGCVFHISQLDQTENSTFLPQAYAQGVANKSGATITGTSTFPLFGGIDVSILKYILAFGALIALPSIPDIIGRTIGRLGVAGQLIGQEIGGSYGAGQRYAGQFQQGVGGFAGQAGQLTTQPGYIYKGGQWIRYTGGKGAGLTEMEKIQSGFRPGLGAKWWSGIKTRFGIKGGGKPPIV